MRGGTASRAYRGRLGGNRVEKSVILRHFGHLRQPPTAPRRPTGGHAIIPVMDWIWPLYREYVDRNWGRKLALDEPGLRRTFLSVLGESTATLYVMEPINGTVRFKGLGRWPSPTSRTCSPIPTPSSPTASAAASSS